MAEFVDAAQLHVRAGDGGAGSVSFRREAHVDKGGPDGGDGGDGGSVALRSVSHLSSLIGFRDQPFRRARSGGHGQGKRCHGANGPEVVVDVPIGTVIRTLDGEVVADLHEVNMTVEVARGGRGGAGNARFLSNRRRAPAFAEQGEAGEDLWLNLELKLAADVALVGEPNVGKSSLIAAVSRARPKIADYPFTTLIPNLGVVRVGDQPDIVVADIPGLIEGAAEGRGLGHAFLRHVERAKVLVIVVSLSEPPEAWLRSAEAIIDEVRRYQESLALRPRVVVGTKLDLCERPSEAAAAISAVAAEVGAVDGGVVSGVTHEGIAGLSRVMVYMVGEVRRGLVPGVNGEIVVQRPRPRYEVAVERLGDRRFAVVGRDAIRAVGFSDVGSVEAMAIVHHRLDRMGALRALRRLGADDGDEVVVGGFVFTYQSE
ncbi:MAG: GTPase ObgE [Ferrimicrobium sp.]